VGRREAPCTLTVYILGGACYLELDVEYKPSSGFISTRVSIGIFAAASLAISLGPVKGGIYAYFGITVEYRASNRNSSSLTIGLLLLFRGEVRLLGIVNVSLTLSLEAQYSPGGGLVGRGRISLKIKICWCFTISVNAGVEYRFGSGSRSAKLESVAPASLNAAADNPYQQAATRYVGMFA
jgi:hypothetical protein